MHSGLMPHQIASATGCSLDEAMSLLLHLSTLDIAKAKTLVYHINDNTDPPVSILTRNLNEGPPELPLVCPICGQDIENYEELLFDFIFILNTKPHFKE